MAKSAKSQTAFDIVIQLHPTQRDFTHSRALYRGFVGGRGSGKTFVGAYDMLRRAGNKRNAGRLYAVYAPTYAMLRDATLRTFMELGERLCAVVCFAKSDMVATLYNRAQVLFRSLDEPERARGPNLSGAWMDEASLVPREAYDIIIASLRERGEAGWLSATFTPKGLAHWTYDVFGRGGPNVALFHCRTRENPFLPPEFYESVRRQYTQQFAEQELEGKFVNISSGVARREWFSFVDAVPAEARRVRHWDLAATEKSVRSDDPDYTVGTLLAVQGGTYYVESVIRERCGPGAVESLVVATAHADGRGVAVSIEEEPGASGKLLSASLVRALAGWNVRAAPATGDKLTRAMPWLAQAEAGNVRLLRAHWNRDWLDEVCSFPSGAHDDQVDSMSGAFAALQNALTGRLFF